MVVRANLLVFQIVLFGGSFVGIFSVFGTVQSVIVSRAGVSVFAAV